MSSTSTPQAAGRSACSPSMPSFPSSSTPMFNMLQTAAEQMMIDQDFQAVFDTCNKGLQTVSSLEQDDLRYAEFKAGFCILGIQALAEMNRWPGVLSWVLQQYDQPEKIPAKVLQLCILLYSKVCEPAVMQDTARVWLHFPSNSTASGFRTVAELYLLHILVPLGHLEEARALVTGEIGSDTFTEDQRRTALEVVEEKERDMQEPENPASPETPAEPVTPRGTVIHKLEAMLVFLHRRVRFSGSGWLPLRRLFLAAVLLYMLFIRMDPALPSSFMWISKLLQLIKQMWNAMFAPYHQSKAL
ncbi:peroxisome assembly protein 26 [Salarias fasciatus]|uniref:Peroxisomal biogenesis factor 26 n=1 Tax=Salarias fasciatus TaxID=181472 RepID=A0A672G7A0_SALFA|nr:peroxisome assembly protein 26 [Salarias fasciatus]